MTRLTAASGRRFMALGAIVWLSAFALVAAVRVDAQADGWTIPADAAELKSPLEATPAVLKQGAEVFESRCRACHGPQGKGNGPLSDPSHPAANLTAGARADLLPDGVLFYRVWNGRKPMPAFKTELSKDEVWAVVEHVKSLRKE